MTAGSRLRGRHTGCSVCEQTRILPQLNMMDELCNYVEDSRTVPTPDLSSYGSTSVNGLWNYSFGSAITPDPDLSNHSDYEPPEWDAHRVLSPASTPRVLASPPMPDREHKVWDLPGSALTPEPAKLANPTFKPAKLTRRAARKAARATALPPIDVRWTETRVDDAESIMQDIRTIDTSDCPPYIREGVGELERAAAAALSTVRSTSNRAQKLALRPIGRRSEPSDKIKQQIEAANTKAGLAVARMGEGRSAALELVASDLDTDLDALNGQLAVVNRDLEAIRLARDEARAIGQS